jgi:hypothetical protein
MNKHKITNTNHQIITNIPMTETFPSPPGERGGEGCFGYWIIGIYLELGIWLLEFNLR